MPGASSVLDVQRVCGSPSIIWCASPGLGLAVTFQSRGLPTGCGSRLRSSSIVQGLARARGARRIDATSAAEIIDAWLPNALRANDPTSAIHWSALESIETICATYVLPCTG